MSQNHKCQVWTDHNVEVQPGFSEPHIFHANSWIPKLLNLFWIIFSQRRNTCEKMWQESETLSCWQVWDSSLSSTKACQLAHELTSQQASGKRRTLPTNGVISLVMTTARKPVLGSITISKHFTINPLFTCIEFIAVMHIHIFLNL